MYLNYITVSQKSSANCYNSIVTMKRKKMSLKQNVKKFISRKKIRPYISVFSFFSNI